MKNNKKSNPITEIFNPIYNNKFLNQKEFKIRKVCSETRLQSTTALTVRRWNDEHLESSSAFILASTLIQSTDQQHGSSIHLRSVDDSVVPHLVFLQLWVLGLISDLIDILPGWSVNQSTDHRSFIRPTLGQNSSSFFEMLGPPVDDHHLRTVDGTTGRDGFVGHLFCTIFCISVLNDFPIKHI